MNERPADTIGAWVPIAMALVAAVALLKATDEFSPLRTACRRRRTMASFHAGDGCSVGRVLLLRRHQPPPPPGGRTDPGRAGGGLHLVHGWRLSNPLGCISPAMPLGLDVMPPARNRTTRSGPDGLGRRVPDRSCPSQPAARRQSADASQQRLMKSSSPSVLFIFEAHPQAASIGFDLTL